MKVAIIGSNGQLGTDLVKAFKAQHEVLGFTHKDLDVADYNSCLVLKEHRPEIIINTAAFHKTDQCEEEPIKTFAVNAIGAKNIAAISQEIGATTVLISIDYVFDGLKNEPYTEDDAPKPINTYGISKLAGECSTRQNPKHYIIRVASLFEVAGASGKGGNFAETMIDKAKKGETINVVDDMLMSPTYTKDAAETIKKIVELNLPFGVYHVTNEGRCSCFQFACEIFNVLNLSPKVNPIKTCQIQTKAKRPMFSALQSVKLPKHGIKMQKWEEVLKNYLAEKGHLQKA